MATRTTLSALIDDHFHKTLAVTAIGDMQIAITNEPDYDAGTFTVTAAGTRRDYRYPLFGNEALSLTDIDLSLTYNGPSTPATGTISADLCFGGIDLNVTATLSRAAESFVVTSQLLDPISLMQVVDSLSGGKSVAPPGLAKAAIRSVGMTIGQDARAGWTVAAQCQLAQKWTLPIGTQSVDAAFSVVYQGEQSVDLRKLALSGTLALGKSGSLTLAYDFGPKLAQLKGALASGGSPIVIGDLLKLFGIRVPGGFPNSIGNPKGLDLESGAFTLDFAANAVQLSGRNSFGEDAFTHARQVGGKWALALGIGTRPGWKMANLAGALKPVDRFLTFDRSFVALSTGDMEIDDTVFAKLEKNRFRLTEGLNVGAAIRLDRQQTSVLAQALHGLLGGDIDFFLEAGIGPRPDDVYLTASLDDLKLNFSVPRTTKKQTLAIEAPEIAFTLHPSLSIGGTVAFPTTQPGATIDVGGRIELSESKPGVVSITFAGFVHDDRKQLPPPKNASGVELRKIGGLIKAGPGMLEIGLDGCMSIGPETADFAFDFAVAPELAPTFLYARFDRLELAPMFAALCKDGKLPSSLRQGIEFQGVEIWSCNDPSGPCSFSDGKHVTQGFAFSGDANVFGFPADATLSVTTTGMSGRLMMGRAISIPGVVSLSDAADRTKGPQFAFNTNSSPYLDADYLINILGVTDTARLNFSRNGFSLKTSVSFKGRALSLLCVLSARPPDHYAFTIAGTGDFRKNPIDLIDLGIGTLKLTRIDLRFSADKGIFSARADAKIGGVNRHAQAQISLRQIAHDLSNLGKQLEKALSNKKKWL